MLDQLLLTKLYVPRVHANLVARQRLVGRLEEGMERKLTLISAPPGFGKTTLLGEWQTLHIEEGRTLAWISLDEGDNDPARFLSYLVGALRGVCGGIGQNAQVLLGSPGPPPVREILTGLINEVAETPYDFALVLDDYHLIENPTIHEAVSFLLDYLPPPVHLVIASRTVPPLPIPRLRARGQFMEIRAKDLRFQPEEAARFLKDAMGLDLAAEDVAQLEARTEGWIAGLQLAAHAMRGRKDISGFMNALDNHPHILDYLAEEVFQRQPEYVQNFLLETSVLERMSGSLCEVVTERSGGRTTLEGLEKANLFTVALDEERRWYRYHHLFSGFLRERLERVRPEEVTLLHRRASSWYEETGLTSEAVEHAFQAADWDRAARLVEGTSRKMLGRSEAVAPLRWLEALPEERFRDRPRLYLYYAAALMMTGRFEDAGSRLDEAESIVNARGRSGDSGERRELLGGAMAVRAHLARVQEDFPRTIELSRRALEELPEGNLLERGLVALNLGYTHASGGDLSAAVLAFREAARTGREAGNDYVTLTALTQLARLQMIRGCLSEAARIYERELQSAVPDGERPPPVAAYAYVGMAEILYERNELRDAQRRVEEGIELAKRGGIAYILLFHHVVLARIKQAQGDANAALEAMEEAERLVGRRNLLRRSIIPLGAYWTRLYLAQGNLREAARWVREREPALKIQPAQPYDREYVTLVRVLLAQNKSGEALELLAKLLEAATAGERIQSVIEILALETVAHGQLGDEDRAKTTLEHALSLAEPEGYVRTFIDEGAPMAALLAQLARDRKKRRSGILLDSPASPEYVSRLLAALEADPGHEEESRSDKPPVPALSRRELEVLELISSGLSNQKIAEELFVSVSTVKTHVKNLCDKLGTRSRTQSLARARKLGLLR